MKTKKAKRKVNTTRSLKHLINRLTNAHKQTIDARNQCPSESFSWTYHDGHADGLSYAIHELRNEDKEG